MAKNLKDVIESAKKFASTVSNWTTKTVVPQSKKVAEQVSEKAAEVAKQAKKTAKKVGDKASAVVDELNKDNSKSDKK